MDTLFGLPAHPLLVHTPVVFGPLAFLATIVVAARPSWRARYGWGLVGLAFVLMISVFLATSSGEALAEVAYPNPPFEYHEHEELAEMTRLLTVAQFVVVAAWVGVGRVSMRVAAAAESAKGHWSGVAVPVAAVVSVVVALLQMIWMIRTGHAGAQLTWE